MEFLSNARKLQIYTIRKAANFPKKYRFFISTNIASIATRIYEYAKCGNSIFPTNSHEVQLRRDYFMKARAESYNLSAQLEIAKELFNVDVNELKEWSRMIDFEIQLLKAVINADKARYKDIK